MWVRIGIVHGFGLEKTLAVNIDKEAHSNHILSVRVQVLEGTWMYLMNMLKICTVCEISCPVLAVHAIQKQQKSGARKKLTCLGACIWSRKNNASGGVLKTCMQTK